MLKACYSPHYYAKTKSNSMEKLTAVAEAVQARGVATLVEPDPIDPEILRRLHNPDFVDAFLTGQAPLAQSQRFIWNEQLRDAVLYIHGGQLCAAEIALREGIAANIAQGFHHAEYDYGGGYCTFNGLALLAQQYPEKRVFVLDCDQHGGNGTAEFTRSLENLFNYTIFGLSYGCREYERSVNAWIPRDHGSFEQYQAALEAGFAQILAWQTDLLIYQAGMDCHQLDPFGSDWFDSESLYQRDRLVFDFAKQHGIPIVFVLAGGYQALPALTELHVGTFVAAQSVYFSE
ncbi:MAG: histone deacetylase [Pseudomonadota bacterium]|nr:histone deacetylase [Pseudomonadota bacterium]